MHLVPSFFESVDLMFERFVCFTDDGHDDVVLLLYCVFQDIRNDVRTFLMHRARKEAAREFWQLLLRFVRVDEHRAILLLNRVRDGRFAGRGDADDEPDLSLFLLRALAIELVGNALAECLPLGRVDLVGRAKLLDERARIRLAALDVLVHRFVLVIAERMRVNPRHSLDIRRCGVGRFRFFLERLLPLAEQVADVAVELLTVVLCDFVLLLRDVLVECLLIFFACARLRLALRLFERALHFDVGFFCCQLAFVVIVNGFIDGVAIALHDLL